MTTATAPRAYRRIEAAINAVTHGTMDPASAVAIVECLAAAVPVAAYDAALDAIMDAAPVDADLNPRTSKQAKAAQRKARQRARLAAHGDSDTRRARQRAHTFDATAARDIGKGAPGVPGNNLRYVSGARPWRTTHKPQPVALLQTVWAVDSAGEITDAAYTFGTPKGDGRGLTGPTLVANKLVIGVRAHTTGIVPNLRYRVPASRCMTAAEHKAAWMAQREGAITAEREARAKAYRNQAGDGPVAAQLIGWHENDTDRYSDGLDARLLAEIGAENVVCPTCNLIGVCDC